MITINTVLILGAGASIPYGFPSGRNLINIICSSLNNLNSECSRKLLSCGFDKSILKEFSSELFNSMQPSVDLFLEKRIEFIDVGKAAISCALIPYEQKVQMQRDINNLNWYEYLFHKLNTTKETFHENNLTILTYNYDRSIEYFLSQALKHTYGIDDKEAANLLITSIPIIHVYGQFGNLPHFGENIREFKEKTTTEDIKLCASRIRIISEVELNPKLLDLITKVLDSASNICFLGCGYHEPNIKLIFKNFWETENFKFKHFYGSCYGLEEGEKAEIKYILKANHLKLGTKEMDCLKFLRSYPIFN